LQTIKQLVFEKNGKRYLKGCSIVDWRLLQCVALCRMWPNFQSMKMLKEQIDVLAAYKFNVFHFHVTENQGWRLESKIYPQLNSPESMSASKRQILYTGRF
jgi:hypothetical protein